MKNTICAYALFSLLALGGCASPHADSSENVTDVEEIKLDEEHVEEVAGLLLSDAAKSVDVVKLERYGRSVINDIKVLHVTEHDIFVQHLGSPLIVRFGRDGKFLNEIGQAGRGTEQYLRPIYFWLDDEAKEVYVMPAHDGIKVYDYDGNFVRIQTDKLPEEMFMAEYASSAPVIYHLHQFFLKRQMPFVKPLHAFTNDVWSVALVDEDFDMVKSFKNPAHAGRELEILEHSLNVHENFGRPQPQLWSETPNECGLYGGELTVKFADADTIYRWENNARTFVPKYALYTGEEKDDFTAMHSCPFDSARFNYMHFIGYYPSRDYIYLKATQRGNVYGFRYDKSSNRVQRRTWSVGLKERVPDNPFWGYMMPESTFLLKNDFNGGVFQLEHRSGGKYWIDVLSPRAPYFERYAFDLKASSDNSPQKRALLDAIESSDEYDNPILLIATLK